MDTAQLFQGRKLDEAAIKYIAAVTMLIDHITCGILEVGRTQGGQRLMDIVPGAGFWDSLGRSVGRTAFPIFLFFLVEGYLHTRSRKKYLGLLLVFAALAYLPFKRLVFPGAAGLRCNTLFTLSLGMAAIWAIDELAAVLKVKRRLLPVRTHVLAREGENIDPPAKWQPVRIAVLAAGGVAVTAVCCYAARMIHSDYSYGGVLAVVILNVLYRHRAAALLLTWCWLSYYNSYELLSIVGFGLLLCYNGLRGKQNKYFFYFFYPGHLLLIWLIRLAVLGS